MIKGSHAFRFLLFLGFVLLAGCAISQPTSLYVLTEKPPRGEEADPKAVGDECLRVRLDPVTFPGYLDRSGIVTRAAPNRLSLSELHHWAEPLEENFTRVLADNLDARLCGDVSVVTVAPASEKSDYFLRVDIRRFEPLRRKKVVLRATWSIRDQETGRTVQSEDSTYEHTLEGTDHQSVAAAMSGAIASLSRDVADTLHDIARRSGKR